MADDVPPTPDDEADPPIDPFEAELVAYLDGELDLAAARKIEVRLATDPAARAKAAALKKTFDLLDYLPKPDPSPNFTTKTLDKLPAVKSGAVVTPPPQATMPAAQAVPAPTVVALPMPPEQPAPARRGLWAAAALVAACACALGGYFVAAALRPAQQVQNPPDELPISDRGVVERLPLYAAADDLDFVRALSGPDYFGDDPAVSFDVKLAAVQPVATEAPSGPAFEKLAEAFKALPAARQEAIRELHRQLTDLADRDERDRLLRVLEAYAIWLDRLPPTERKGVLAVASGTHRLDEIRSLRERQWVDSLPLAQREKIRGLPPAEKAEVIGQWRRAELEAREEWDFVRDHADDIAANRVPWPFDDPALKKEVIEFVRVTFHTDKPTGAGSRLTANEFDRLNASLREANQKQGWAWHAYGKLAYDLTRRYEPWLLPEPARGEPLTRPQQLPKQYDRYLRGPGAKVAQSQEGKWPEYALAVHALSQFSKGERPPALGPAKPMDFKEPLRVFITRDLMKALSFNERRNLENQEGRWPDYPREVLKLAKLHNLSAPGMMLPGPPRQWDAQYRSRTGPGFGPARAGVSGRQ
jgi:hypothetical protein